MSLEPAAYKDTWLWRGETGFPTELNETDQKLIGVAPESYSQAKFTKDETLELENQIYKEMIRASPVPKFIMAYNDGGILVADCVDQYSLTWLKSSVNNVQYRGQSLKVGVKSKIPFWRISFLSPKALTKEAPEELVNALVLQNAELKGLWAVEGTEIEATGQRVKCFVNDEVMNGLRRLRNMVYLGMHRITVNLSTE